MEVLTDGAAPVTLLHVAAATVSLTVAMGAAIGGNSALVLVAADAAADAGNSLAPWLQGGGSAAAVAGLVYVARMIVRGELVPRPVKDTEAELTSAIRASGEREARLMQVIEEQREMLLEARAAHTSQMQLQGDTTRALWEVDQEMRYWRERRPRP